MKKLLLATLLLLIATTSTFAAIPGYIDPTVPENSEMLSLGAQRIRELKQFIVDIFGVPVATNITAPAFSVTSGGVVTSYSGFLVPTYTYASLPATCTNGQLARLSDNIRGFWVCNTNKWTSITGHASVTDWGASTAATAADNTTAFNATIALGGPVFVPCGTWDLNALASIAAPIHLYGAGRCTILRFNTTADAIHINPVGSLQEYTFHISDLAFANVTNVPASFIRNQAGLNVKLERLYFSNTSATICIDNESGYGTTISDSVFSDITGSGVRLQNDQNGTSKYSYAFTLRNNDFTRLSGHGILVDGSSVLNIFGGVLEGITGNAIWTNYRVEAQYASIQSWGINIQGVYFESNGTDIKCESSISYSCRITMTASTMVGTPTIDLGSFGRFTSVGGQQGGGNSCTISGSQDARVLLVGHVLGGFVQSGTFQWNDLGMFYDTVSTPIWSSSGTQPVLGNGTFTSHWSRTGNRATLDMYLKAGSTTTFGSGTYYFSDTLLALLKATHFEEAVGSAMLYDSSGAYHAAVAYMVDDQTIAVAFTAASSAGYITATSPWTWAVNDFIKLSITYRSN